MAAVTEDEVLDALSSVIEPENDEDIITLQRTRSKINNNKEAPTDPTIALITIILL